jgi:hypothetical protein
MGCYPSRKSDSIYPASRKHGTIKFEPEPNPNEALSEERIKKQY